MLLREVLSDTHQPLFVEAADQQEHKTRSLTRQSILWKLGALLCQRLKNGFIGNCGQRRNIRGSSVTI